jgi:hypothetical protein
MGARGCVPSGVPLKLTESESFSRLGLLGVSNQSQGAGMEWIEPGPLEIAGEVQASANVPSWITPLPDYPSSGATL